MDVVVIGAGALGTILAAHLSTAGHQVTVLARGRRAAQVKQHGIIVRGLVELNAECNVLDHPAAIDFYRRHQFKETRTEVQTVEDPRETGILPKTAGPHIPLNRQF